MVILCRGINCEVEFLPRKKDQVFCSAYCRQEYFRIARGIGVVLLEGSRDNEDMKSFIYSLISILQEEESRLGIG